MTAPTLAGGRRRGLGVGLVIVVGLVVVVAILGGSHSSGGAADDPASTSPDGAKALALLVARLGGVVDTSGALPAPGRGVALVLTDRLTSSGRDRLTAWVRSGGTLVVADPDSDLADVSRAEGPTPDSGVTASGTVPPGCSAPWVAGVDQIDLPSTDLLAPPADATATCFGSGGAWFAVERPLGSGSVVSLAGPDLWTNQDLGQAANSVLAADLLVPGPGARLAWLTGTVGGGRQTLADVIPGRVWALGAGGLLAALVAVAWRARRLGRPVVEEVPVVIPGSALVQASGRLLQRNRQRGRAAELLRAGAGAASLDGADPADDAALLTLAVELGRRRHASTATGTDRDRSSP